MAGILNVQTLQSVSSSLVYSFLLQLSILYAKLVGTDVLNIYSLINYFTSAAIKTTQNISNSILVLQNMLRSCYLCQFLHKKADINNAKQEPVPISAHAWKWTEKTLSTYSIIMHKHHNLTYGPRWISPLRQVDSQYLLLGHRMRNLWFGVKSCNLQNPRQRM